MSFRSPLEVADKVVLITGASRGVGHAVARAAARAGATLLISGRDVAALERLADDIEAGGGTEAVIVPLNLEGATVDDYALVAAHIDERFGRLDGVVVNAAALGELAPVVSYDAVTWARVFQVNLHSAFLLLQACLPLLARSDAGSVVFSLAEEGLRAKPHWGAYAVSKYALRGLLEVLAAEHHDRPQLRFNGVLLPAVRTRLRQTAYPALNPATLVDPDAVTAPYLMLLGAGGAGLNGRIVRASDGTFEP